MGNQLDPQERWQNISLKSTTLPDVNAFLDEIKLYNDKVNRIRDALILAEQNLMLYLGLLDIETFTSDGVADLTIKEVTLSIFYSFNAFFKGDFVRMMDLKFNEDGPPPYFELNIHYLNPLLKDAWLQYQKYLATLENTADFSKALILKYKQFYADYYERFYEFMQESVLPTEINQIDIMMHNYQQITRVAENLGQLEQLIEEKYILIREAVRVVKFSSETLQMAVVSRVNKIKYPDEVIAKMLQLKNVKRIQIQQTKEYQHNQKRNYERYLFVSNKYLEKDNKDGQAERKSRLQEDQRAFQEYDEHGQLLEPSRHVEEQLHTGRNRLEIQNEDIDGLEPRVDNQEQPQNNPNKIYEADNLATNQNLISNQTQGNDIQQLRASIFASQNHQASSSIDASIKKGFLHSFISKFKK